jgi:hypothetical protein
LDGTLEQVGVGSGAVEDNLLANQINFINKKPVRLNMTFGFAFISAMEKVIMTARRKRYLIDNEGHHVFNFIYVLMALFHKFHVFFEVMGKGVIQHLLTTQSRFKIIKGMMPNGGYFPLQHSVPFLKSRNGNGVGGVVKGTIAVNAYFGLAVFLLEIADKIKDLINTLGGKSFNFSYQQFGSGHTLNISPLGLVVKGTRGARETAPGAGLGVKVEEF